MLSLSFHKNVLHKCKHTNVLSSDEIHDMKFDKRRLHIHMHSMAGLVHIIHMFFISIIVGVATNVSCQLFVASMSSINTDDMVSNLFFNLQRIIC